MEPCVSIIIPIYNAESTLRRCVESVLSQEYADFELILSDFSSAEQAQYAQLSRRVQDNIRDIL